MSKPAIKYRAKISVLTSFPGMHYIEIPKKTINALGGGYKHRLICTVNKSVKFQCGMMPLGGGKAFIMITKARLKALNAESGDYVEVELIPDKSKYGMAVPPELKELLKQDIEGRKRFSKLTPGRQRNIIHYVASVKNSDSRLERAFLLISNLKNCEPGKETFRKLLGIRD